MSNHKVSKKGKSISQSSKKGTKKSIKQPIVPVSKEPFGSRILKSVDVIKNTIKSNADAALTVTEKFQRKLKSYFSSDFEALLLRLTSPDDSRPVEDDVLVFTDTIDTFVRNMDVSSQSNPYRVTLRKLWRKAAESDGHSVLKALYLLHIILRNSSPEDCIIFKTILQKMFREKCKKVKSKYFDMKAIIEVSSETEYLRDFIEAYSLFVIQRAKTFTSDFEEMKLIAYGMRTEDICAQVS